MLDWQEIIVTLAIVVALGGVIFYAIGQWRSLKRGECGHCAGCGGRAADKLPDDASAKERIVFLPAESLRDRAAQLRRPRA